jgi:hypothetical protein
MAGSIIGCRAEAKEFTKIHVLALCYRDTLAVSRPIKRNRTGYSKADHSWEHDGTWQRALNWRSTAR